MKLPRYPKYKDSGVTWLGQVPEHWEVKALKYPATLNDDDLPENTDPDYEITYVDIGSVSLERGIEKAEVMPFGEAPSRARRRVKSGDVIVSTVRTYLKAICPIEQPTDNLVVSTGFAVVRPRQRDMTPQFAHYALQSQIFIDQVIAQSSGVSYPAINPSELQRIKIPIPPPCEQKSISDFLEREIVKLDALVEQQRLSIELLKEKRQAVISHAVTKGLVPDTPMKPSGYPLFGRIPKTWRAGKLRRFAYRVVVGIAEATTQAYADHGVPILRATNIRPGKIEGELLRIDPQFSGDRVSKQLRAGDLVTVRTGYPGVTAVIPKELGGCQCFTMLITSLRNSQSARYQCYFLNSTFARQYFDVEGWGSAQTNISVPILQDCPVPSPSFREQEEIADHLDEKCEITDSLIVEANHAIELFQERRSALISAAVTGQIDLRNYRPQEASAVCQ